MGQDRQKIILASGSPRRRELLIKAGYDIEVVVPGISEDVCRSKIPSILVECLAYSKARCVAEHQVITGVCLIDAATRLRVIGHDVTNITMKKLSKEAIGRYVADGESMGKAGAYAIQERSDRFIERISGSFTNVVGLPMELVAVMLKQLQYRIDREGNLL